MIKIWLSSPVYAKARTECPPDRLDDVMGSVLYKLGWKNVKTYCGEYEDVTTTIISELKQQIQKVERIRRRALQLLDDLRENLKEYMRRSGVELPRHRPSVPDIDICIDSG